MNQKDNRKVYIEPTIEIIKLDNEISLSLDSDPAVGPGEPGYVAKVPEYFNNDPYKLT